MTSYGVCGHLLDSLSACDHSATLMKPEQAHFGRLYVRMFFRKASPQTEGRRHADLLIKKNGAGLFLQFLSFSFSDPLPSTPLRDSHSLSQLSSCMLPLPLRLSLSLHIIHSAAVSLTE